MIGTMALAGCDSNNKVSTTGGIHYEYMDSTCRPGDDFYKFVTGHWLEYNPQPKEYAMWGAFGLVRENTMKQLADLIQGIAAETHEKGTVEQKIADLYNMAMDSVRRNQEGAAPLMPYLKEITDINTREELLALMEREHDNLLFSMYNGADEKDSKNNVLSLGQGGLSLGTRDYYLNDDAQTVKIREAFKQHVINMFKLAGYDEEIAKAKMETVMKYETEIAQVSYSKLQLRVPEDNYHKMSLAELVASTGFDWDTYFKANTYDKTDTVVVGQPEPLTLACKLLMEAPLEDLKSIYEWRAISGASDLLSDDFRMENFSFNQIVTGVEEDKPRWKRCVALVDGIMSDAVGQMYVQKYFPSANKERMLKLVGNLQEALGKRIQAQEWMSDSTKAVALDKLASFYVKIGYPDTWDDLTNLQVDPTRSLLDNMHDIQQFYWNLDKQKHYNTPVDKNEWLMSPQTVNAYYNPTTNELCFPAAILQFPFFEMSADDAMNYGAIGVVIGHEMTHGFDDQGRQYDKEGNLRVWWNEQDIEKFKEPTEKLACYFDSLWVIPGELHANGHLCLGENLADHGGVMVAYEAFQKAIGEAPLSEENGFTPEQRFFLSYANVWAGICSTEMLHYLTVNDVHSIGRLRVNGTLPHITQWCEAFGVQPGDSLYVAPEDRVNIW